MEFLTELWLPILLSAVFVFVASSILHMVLPIHRKDYEQIPGEASVLAAMREQGITRGDYHFPFCREMKDMSSPEMLEKYKQGPVGFLTILPSGPMTMGKSLVQWFLYSVLVGLFVAYASWNGLGPGAGFAAVFRVVGAAAIAAYGIANLPDSIWKGHKWSNTAKHLGDGVVYGLVTAATFGWLWPEVAPVG